MTEIDGVSSIRAAASKLVHEKDNTIVDLRRTLLEIIRIADICRNEMKGRISDDQHHRAFRALVKIIHIAGEARS